MPFGTRSFGVISSVASTFGAGVLLVDRQSWRDRYIKETRDGQKSTNRRAIFPATGQVLSFFSISILLPLFIRMRLSFVYKSHYNTFLRFFHLFYTKNIQKTMSVSKHTLTILKLRHINLIGSLGKNCITRISCHLYLQQSILMGRLKR